MCADWLFAIFVRYSSSTKEEGSSRHCLKALLKSGIGCNLLAKLHFLALSFYVLETGFMKEQCLMGVITFLMI